MSDKPVWRSYYADETEIFIALSKTRRIIVAQAMLGWAVCVQDDTQSALEFPFGERVFATRPDAKRAAEAWCVEQETV